MFIDGIDLIEGSETINLTVPVGGSFPSNENSGELFFITGDGLYYNDGTNWNPVLNPSVTRNLTTGFTTDVEVLGSNTITPDMSTESIKTRSVDGNVTVNFPTVGNGVAHIILEADSGGSYTITLNANVKAIGTVPDLAANTTYLMSILRRSATSAMVQVKEISA